MRRATLILAMTALLAVFAAAQVPATARAISIAAAADSTESPSTSNGWPASARNSSSPSHLDAIVSYAFRLMLAEELDEAHMMFMVLAELFPESDVAFDSLGEIYVRLGNTEAAIAAFEQSLDLNPDNRNAAERLKVLKVPTQAPPSQSASPSPLTVWYLGHCGFAVQVGEKLLVFDYLSDMGTPSRDPDAGGLADGVIEPADFPEVMAERGYESVIPVPRRRGDRWVIGG